MKKGHKGWKVSKLVLNLAYLVHVFVLRGLTDADSGRDAHTPPLVRPCLHLVSSHLRAAAAASTHTFTGEEAFRGIMESLSRQRMNRECHHLGGPKNEPRQNNEISLHKKSRIETDCETSFYCFVGHERDVIEGMTRLKRQSLISVFLFGGVERKLAICTNLLRLQWEQILN